MRRPFLKWLMASAVVGLMIPTGILLTHELVPGAIFFGDPLFPATRVLWPTSYWPMATDGIEGTPRAYLFISMSIAANAMIYSAVGCLLWGIKHLVNLTRSPH